jgi:hypothetical protein
MKKKICILIQKMTFGRVCLGWCKLKCELTAFNMGITLNKGQVINSTDAYTPSLVSGTYT